MSSAGQVTLEPATALGNAPSAADDAIAAARRERLVIFILWALLLAESLFFAFVQPVWSRVDEAQHFHYVQYLVENRSLPVEGQTFISPEVVAISRQKNQWGWRPAGALSTPVYLDPGSWNTVPPDLTGEDREKWVRRNLWYFNYEAMQPPLYYAVNTPVYAALPDDPLTRLYGMRVLAALIASSMVPLTWLMAREVFPDSRLVVYGAPVVAVLTQGYALNMSQMSNDVLTVPLAAAAILMMLRVVSRGLKWKSSLLIGALIAGSLLAKMTTVFLLPLAALAPAMLVAYRREKPLQVLKHCGIIFGLVAALMSPWVIHNIAVYGDATGASAARPLMSSFFWSPVIDSNTLRLYEILPTYWFGEPVFPFPFWTWSWVAVGSAIVLAVLGVAFYFMGLDGRHVARTQMKVLFMVFVFVIGVTVNLLIPFASGIGGVPGRYLYPLIPVIAFLIVFGVDRLFRRERARFVAELMLAWMIFFEALNILGYVKAL